MKTKIFAVSLFSALLIFGVIVGLRSSTTVTYLRVADLIAGQHYDVGNVKVWRDGDILYVKYETIEGWYITETHVEIAFSDLTEIPQKNGNPTPGKFTYSIEHTTPVTEYTEEIDLAPLGGQTPRYIAAHAAVFEVIGDGCESPQWATKVEDYKQGTLEGGGPITNPARMDPNKALGAPDASTSPPPIGFYSLGFVSNDDGYIVLSFDYPIYNGEGADIKVYEVTWGRPGYPREAAKVYVIVDGTETYAGTVTNKDDGGVGVIYIPSSFTYVDAIKLVDATDKDDFSSRPSADGYDLDAVGACYLYHREETAWGAGCDFPGKNWATYFTLPVRYPETGTAYIGYEDLPDGDFDYNDFGMNFSVEEIYDGNDFLLEVTMTFTAVIYDSGMDHLIHIRRPFIGSYTYTVTRDPSYVTPDLIPSLGNETPPGTYAGSGELDVVLFNTAKYGWPQKQIDETVVVEVVLEDPSSNPKLILAPPRSYTVDSTTFYDLDPIMANYDPWEEGTMYGSLYHISNIQPTAKFGSPSILVPYILVIPYTDWIPPWESTIITGPYGYFADFYKTGMPTNWYHPSMVTNNIVEPGGLSWGPY